MNLEFKQISCYPRGTIYGLLKDAYSSYPGYEQLWSLAWQECDSFFYDHPDIANRYGFITTIEDDAIGFVVWDPRHLPEFAELGHNCIKPQYKGNGYGKRQLAEAISRIKQSEVKKMRRNHCK